MGGRDRGAEAGAAEARGTRDQRLAPTTASTACSTASRRRSTRARCRCSSRCRRSRASIRCARRSRRRSRPRQLETRAYGAAGGHRPDVGVPGFDGHGVTIALLDTGVDAVASVPSRPRASGHRRHRPRQRSVGARRTRRTRRSSSAHGTELAGILVGSDGPAGLRGIAPAASVLPIRVAGWQAASDGRELVYGRSDQLIAGLDRAVDPNGDGDEHDAVRVALVGVAEPYAAFTDGPRRRPSQGALDLNTLVVTPAGNDGGAGPAFGSVAGPAGAPAALAVAATDARAEQPQVRVVLRRGLDVILDERVPLLGAAAPAHAANLRVVAPRATAGVPGAAPIDFFDRRGFSLVAGKAVVLPAGDDPEATVVAASRAGAAAVAALRDVASGRVAAALGGRDGARGRHPVGGLRSSCSPRSGPGSTSASRSAPSHDASEHRPRARRRLLVARSRVRRIVEAEHRRARRRDRDRRSRDRPPTSRRSTAPSTGRAPPPRPWRELRRCSRRCGPTSTARASPACSPATRSVGARTDRGGRGAAQARCVGGRRARGRRRLSLGFGIWQGPHWHATRFITVRNVSSRRLEVSAKRDRRRRLRGAQVQGRSRPLRRPRRACAARQGDGARARGRAAPRS